MVRDIRTMWYLAMHSPDFARITKNRGYDKTRTVLHSIDGGFSAVGVLCDLYARIHFEEHWVKTGLSYEWDGVYLGEAPLEVVSWAFGVRNLGYSVEVEAEIVKDLQRCMFNFDLFCDGRNNFPTEGLLKRIFG